MQTDFLEETLTGCRLWVWGAVRMCFLSALWLMMPHQRLPLNRKSFSVKVEQNNSEDFCHLAGGPQAAGEGEGVVI